MNVNKNRRVRLGAFSCFFSAFFYFPSCSVAASTVPCFYLLLLLHHHHYRVSTSLRLAFCNARNHVDHSRVRPTSRDFYFARTFRPDDFASLAFPIARLQFSASNRAFLAAMSNDVVIISSTGVWADPTFSLFLVRLWNIL